MRAEIAVQVRFYTALSPCKRYSVVTGPRQ